MRLAPLLCSAALLCAIGAASGTAPAAPPKASQAGAKRKAKPAATKKKDAKKKDAAEADAEASETSASAAAAESDGQHTVKDKKATDADTPRAVETQEKEGIKGYKFGAVEVEGRLKSPQVLYFLRRVRAEFAAGDLGHRSFMRELSHTRHDAAFR